MSEMFRIVWRTMCVVWWVIAGCGDNRQVAHLLDAAPDAACVAEDASASSCCALAPDEDAIRACAVPTFPEGSCGVLACVRPDCTFLRVNVCHRYPRCDTLGCVAIACDLQDPTLCTCELATGEYVSCDGSS